MSGPAETTNSEISSQNEDLITSLETTPGPAAQSDDNNVISDSNGDREEKHSLNAMQELSDREGSPKLDTAVKSGIITGADDVHPRQEEDSGTKPVRRNTNHELSEPESASASKAEKLRIVPTKIVNERELPMSPSPPEPPMKGDIHLDKALSASHDDLLPPVAMKEVPFELPEATQGPAEGTGLEIQTIMDQFQSGSAELDEVQIMSPRLERQQSLLMLPPRTSSLENRDTPVGSLSRAGDATDPPIGDLDPNFDSGFTTSRQDDTESVTSTGPGSMFQPPPPAPDPEPTLPFDFHRFLEQLRHRTADPVARFLRSFLNEFGKKQWMVHEQVKIISDFLEFIGKKMAQCDVWRTVSDAEFDNAREGMEKLVMNRLYSQTFSPALPPPASSPRKGGRDLRSQADTASPVGPGRRGQHQEDVERDEVIAQKLRIYGWIREEHLEIKIIGDKGRKFLTLAQQELLKINTYRAPRDKVICVLNCCKVIFGFLKNSKSDQSADAFIPLLIYTVLQARPEHLVSNVQYIWRFRNQDKLGGEAGYYMSSLMGVVTFIENLDRTTLHISDEEFERNVEQAVSAIAQENKSEEYEQTVHAPGTANPMSHLGEKSTPSRPEVTPRNSLEAEQASPRRRLTPRANAPSSQKEDDTDAVSGLLRTIQRPLHTIGRIFSDDTTPTNNPAHLRPPTTPVPMATPRKLSPSPVGIRRPSAERSPSRQNMQAAEAASRQASAETAEAQSVSAREYAAVVETLQNMFPGLDKDVIHDVVRSQQGNVGRAVDACLAMSG